MAAISRDFRARWLDGEDAMVLAFASQFGTAVAVALVAVRVFLAEEPDPTPPYEKIDWREIKHAMIASRSAPVARTAPTPAATPSPADAPTPIDTPRAAPGDADEAAPSSPDTVLAVLRRSRGALAATDVRAVATVIPGASDAPTWSPDDRTRTLGDADVVGDPGPLAPIAGRPRTPTIGPAPVGVPFICEYYPPPDLDPTIDSDRVRHVIDAHLGDLRYCYERRAKERSDLAGRVELTWRIADGRVIGVQIDENRTGDDAFASCLATQVRRWKFAGVADTEVSWPFVFKPRQ